MKSATAAAAADTIPTPDPPTTTTTAAAAATTIYIYTNIPVVPGQAGGGSFQKEKNYKPKKKNCL